MTKRDAHHAILGRLGAGCLTLLLVAQMFVVARAGHAAVGIPILVALSLPFALFAACGLAQLWIEDDGVRIVNTRRAFLIAWDEIEGFSIGRYGLLRAVGIAQLHDGRRVAIWGIQGPNALQRRSSAATQQLIRAMNAELVRRRAVIAAKRSVPVIVASSTPVTAHLRLVS